MNHLEVWETEKQSELGNDQWNRWLDEAQRLIPNALKDLDGDEEVHGYSLDSAFDAFRASKTPAEYAAGWRAHKNPPG